MSEVSGREAWKRAMSGLTRPADATWLPWRRCSARWDEMRCRRRRGHGANHWSRNRRGERASWFWDDSSGYPAD